MVPKRIGLAVGGNGFLDDEILVAGGVVDFWLSLRKVGKSFFGNAQNVNPWNLNER